MSENRLDLSKLKDAAAPRAPMLEFDVRIAICEPPQMLQVLRDLNAQGWEPFSVFAIQVEQTGMKNGLIVKERGQAITFVSKRPADPQTMMKQEGP